MRQNGHLLLGREDDLDTQDDGPFENGFEPSERVLAERGDTHEVVHVPGEAGQAQWVADRGQDLMAEFVEPGGDLSGRQARALGEEHLHGFNCRG